MEILHLSDLHYGRSLEENENIFKIFGWIGRWHPEKPVLITGDLIDSASEDQITGMAKGLRALALTNPILTVPGNHDYAFKGNIFNADSPILWARHLGKPLGWKDTEKSWMISGLGVWKYKGVVFFGLDSSDPEDEKISARGYISESLARRLKENLKEWQTKIRIVFLHHHPFTSGFFTKLYGSDLLLQAVRGNCEVLLFGHEHAYGLWRNQEEIPLICASHKTTARRLSGQLLVTFITIKGQKIQHRLEVIT